MSQPPIRGEQVNSWQGTWNADNAPYAPNDQVRDGEWTMIANKLTSDRAGPTTNGDATFNYPGTNPVWDSNENTSIVEVEHTYTFVEAGWIQEIRIWVEEVTANTKYRVFIFDDTDPANPSARIIETPPLTANAWNTIALGSYVVEVGSIIKVGLWSVDEASSSTFTGGWIYDGASNGAPSSDTGSPIDVAWNHSSNHRIVRINQVDLDSIDRDAQLGGVVPGSTIRFLQTDNTGQYLEYLVLSDPLDVGTYYQYDVELVDTGPLGAPDVLSVNTGDFTVPVASTTKFVSLTDQWVVGSPNNYPSWATITSSLELDGVAQGSPAVDTNDGYGIDIRFQPAYISPDWDIVSSSSNGAGVASVQTLDGLEDVNTGNPGVSEDAFALTWDNGTKTYILAATGAGALLRTGGTMTGDITMSGVASPFDPAQFLGILNGGQSIPAYSFNGDPDTGMFWVSADVLGFSTNALKRFEIEADGTLNVANTANYEALVTSDDDIPNKKYVDAAIKEVPINSQSGLTYTLVLTDSGKLVGRDNASPNTLTVPLNANVAFPVGTQIIIENEGVGQTTIEGEGSPPVTLNSADSLLNLTSQFSTATLIKKATDTWLLAGDLV